LSLLIMLLWILPLSYIAMMITCFLIPRLNPIFYWITVALLHSIFSLPIFKVVIIGQDKIPENGPVVICGKHSEYTDIPFLGIVSLIRQIHFLAKAGLFKFSLCGWWIRAVGSFPIHQKQADLSAVRFATSMLDRGKVVGIMPEGTRRSQEVVGELEPGAAMIAMKSKAVIVPIGIYYRRFYRGRLYWLIAVVGNPIDTANYDAGREGRQQLTVELYAKLVSAQNRAKKIF
jgi:1-acyl-sn-glycerol-3-phosphate acyltransferase